MDANVVYKVVKALPDEEQQLLIAMLQTDFNVTVKQLTKYTKKSLLSDNDAIEYLINNVFRKK